MPRLVISVLWALTLICLIVSVRPAHAFSPSGCEGDCRKCHSLTNQEVQEILKQLNIPQAKILGVQLSPVKSLWEITVEDKGKSGVFYVDFSRRFLVNGPIVEIGNKSNKTQERLDKLQEKKRVNVSKIPLENALVVGNRESPKKGLKKVIVFTDPDCPYCGQLHQEVKKVLEQRRDVVFYLKLFPLPIHKDAYWKSKSVICNKSLKMLEDVFDKKSIPKTECDTKEVDENIKLAESLGISGTPTLVFSDGRVRSGMLTAEKIIELIDKKKS